jgi:hypothetical protein
MEEDGHADRATTLMSLVASEIYPYICTAIVPSNWHTLRDKFIGSGIRSAHIQRNFCRDGRGVRG